MDWICAFACFIRNGLAFCNAIVKAYYEKQIKIKNRAMHFQMLYNSHFQKGNTNLSPIFELKFNSTLTILGFWPRFENYPFQLNRKIGEKSKRKS